MLREMGVTAESEPAGPRAAAEAVLDVGDAAQASERRDLSATTRERLANRINRLTAALERIHEGTYGQCSICGEEIGAARLAAIPEADTCLPCQEQRERADGR
jgi:DnaK suppressor protein